MLRNLTRRLHIFERSLEINSKAMLGASFATAAAIVVSKFDNLASMPMPENEIVKGALANTAESVEKLRLAAETGSQELAKSAYSEIAQSIQTGHLAVQETLLEALVRSGDVTPPDNLINAMQNVINTLS